MDKTILVDLTKCTGCDMCVDVCSAEKTGSYSEKGTRIQIDKDEARGTFYPLICEQCREHPCVDTCPVQAICYDAELSIFRVDAESCSGCRACERVCPYKGIFVSDGVALKCDLCGGEPRCVKICYPGALRYVDVSKEAILADLEHKLTKLKKIRDDTHGQGDRI